MKTNSDHIAFNQPYLTGREITYIADAHSRGQLSGDGFYTKKASLQLQELVGSPRVLLTPSCTAALEMAAILLDVSTGDEIIMPSYTFVSTANAFVLRGATPVFVDVDPITFNIDPQAVEAAITPRTKCIVAVHYAGISCDMDCLLAIGAEYSIPIVEDAAQAILSKYKGKPLGSLGCMSAFSFHETKNITSGEGGSLAINSPDFFETAEIIREKGTNRAQFFRGMVDKYTWVEKGSSYLPGEVISAFLAAQLEEAHAITQRRRAKWLYYAERFSELAQSGAIAISTEPDYAIGNGHMFFLVLKDLEQRQDFIRFMKSKGIMCVFHYVPLHLSPAGLRYSRAFGHLSNTTIAAERLVRLPMGPAVNVEQVADQALKYF
jgi:dTDP-4-amino-4,6-dideoxygalactose transaminase